MGVVLFSGSTDFFTFGFFRGGQHTSNLSAQAFPFSRGTHYPLLASLWPNVSDKYERVVKLLKHLNVELNLLDTGLHL